MTCTFVLQKHKGDLRNNNVDESYKPDIFMAIVVDVVVIDTVHRSNAIGMSIVICPRTVVTAHIILTITVIFPQHLEIFMNITNG